MEVRLPLRDSPATRAQEEEARRVTAPGVVVTEPALVTASPKEMYNTEVPAWMPFRVTVTGPLAMLVRGTYPPVPGQETG